MLFRKTLKFEKLLTFKNKLANNNTNNNIIVQPYILKHEAAFYTTLWCAS